MRRRDIRRAMGKRTANFPIPDCEKGLKGAVLALHPP